MLKMLFNTVIIEVCYILYHGNVACFDNDFNLHPVYDLCINIYLQKKKKKILYLQIKK